MANICHKLFFIAQIAILKFASGWAGTFWFYGFMTSLQNRSNHIGNPAVTLVKADDIFAEIST